MIDSSKFLSIVAGCWNDTHIVPSFQSRVFRHKHKEVSLNTSKILVIWNRIGLQTLLPFPDSFFWQ